MGLLALMSALFLMLCFLISPSLAKTHSLRPKALVLPVTKDSSTGQYITQISQRTPLVPLNLTLDLGGQSLWVDCDQGYVSSSYNPVKCGSAQCSLAKSQSCSETCFNGPKPGCNNNTCSLFPYNSLTQTSTIGELAQDVLSLQSTDGFNPGKHVSSPQVMFTCGATFLLEGLAKGVKGIAGLGRGKVGLPFQLANAFRLKRKFGVCLGSKGVIFFGKSPYKFLPAGRDISISKSLSYTPLLINPVSTAGASFAGEPSVEYFIGVKSIMVAGKPVYINSTLLTINKEGYGGTKISSVVPYTVMETSIYKSFTKGFAKAFSGVPRVKSVAPFGLCFDSSKLGSTRVGPPAPLIDFVFQNASVYWRVFGANSMVQVKKDVLCLGFVDGGENPRTSIVIGVHQVEDNLLQFDLAKSRLGFSSTLLFHQTTCSNFNFTSNA
ncbi:OLC1v1002907C1 [Oldenlandia corymbosa var. corymbosa]|uniref:OLC1v1002907C1 n=1 Tax=Oldenlandia corymbosa var. corymbosa TaxID=529605 RepID=A0AAV1DAH9_OLDCO|nr:OLC1v1002907C1 [Oldenlandia corymbosa var. corymbosa]